jgi:VWFA-related protein
MVLRVTTRLVTVDAIVKDRTGHPVVDLQKEDFRLYENGKLQQIAVFNLERSSPERRPSAASTAKDVYTNVAGSGGTGPPTVLLIDALNTPSADRLYLHRQLTRYVEQRSTLQPMAVYVLGNRLYLLQDFTTDPELLKSALRRFNPETSTLANEHPEDTVDDAIEREMGSLKAADPALIRVMRELTDQQAIAQTDMRAALTLDALRRLGRALSGYAGRKSLVWVSAAFPKLMVSAVDGTIKSDYASDMRRTANLLTDAQIAVYPVDPRGLMETSMADIVLSGRPANPGVDLTLRAAFTSNAHDAMTTLAEQTGGRAFFNTNDVDNAVAESMDDGAVYYTLAYYPSDSNWNGAFRSIEVKVQRSGLEVRSRKGYYATDPEKTARSTASIERREFLSTLEPGNPSATAIPFSARVSVTAQGSTEVDFNVDSHAIRFSRQGDDFESATIEFVVRAYDARARTVGGDSKTIEMKLNAQSFEKLMRSSSLAYGMKLKLPAGKYLLKLGVRDAGANRSGTLSARVDVP